MKQTNWMLKQESTWCGEIRGWKIDSEGSEAREEAYNMEENGSISELKSSMRSKTSKTDLNFGDYDWDMEHVCDDKVRVGHGFG